MSDHFCGQIWIGGKVSKKVLPKLIVEIDAEGLLTDDMERFGDSTEEYLQTAIQNKTPAGFGDDQARNGEFYELEAFLVKNKIAFLRQSSAYCEYTGELILFRPDLGMQKPQQCYCTDSGEPLIPLSILQQRQKAGIMNLDFYELFQQAIPPLVIK